MLPEHRPDALDYVEQAGTLRCGVMTAAEDYSTGTTHGNLSAFGADLCRAAAAAILANRDAVQMTGYPDDAHGLRALQDGSVDVLFGVTPDAANALAYDVSFGPTSLFDAQGILVNRTANVRTLANMVGHKLCYITGTSQETRMNDWLAASGIKLLAHDFQERGEMEAALVGGVCDAITDDVTALAVMRARFHARAKDFAILDDVITIDPWAPAVRAGEVRLSGAITDVLTALITAEQLGITAETVAHPHSGAAMLMGPTPGIVGTLGLADGWAQRAIAAGGNYGTIFDHDLGKGSALGLPRGHDALWTQGGMLAPPPLR